MTTPVKSLALIRAALLAGVLLFGAVCWLSIRQRGGGPMHEGSADAFSSLRFVVPLLCVVALGVAVAMRSMIARERDAAKKSSQRVVAWASGEGAALVGGFHYMQVGDPKLYVLGVVAMLATFIIVPLRET